MLIDVIQEAEDQVQQCYAAWQQALAELRSVEERRKSCEHSFGAAYPGYEHEGSSCNKCGIMELHARTHKIGKC